MNKPKFEDYTIEIRPLTEEEGGGLRKLRWSAKSHGKSGGIRIIYYRFLAHDTILLLFAYAKNERDDLTPEQLRQLKRVIEGEYQTLLGKEIQRGEPAQTSWKGRG
jgi:hypothetical protein